MFESNLTDIVVIEIETTNETESLFSDLSDCNHLVADEITNTISTSATLNVASLLNTEDFENISSPDTFNWNVSTHNASNMIRIYILI